MASQTFHQFPNLPLELQQQIWDAVLPPPIPIKVTCQTRSYYGNPLPPRLKITTPPPPIFHTLYQISHPSLPTIKPIYLRTLQNTKTTTLYIRPNIDILCLENLNTLNGYDIDFLISRNSTNLRVLGVTAETISESIRLPLSDPCGPDFGFARLMKGLQGLEVVYVLRGEEERARWAVGRMLKIEGIFWGLVAEREEEMRERGIEKSERVCLVWQELEGMSMGRDCGIGGSVRRGWRIERMETIWKRQR